jgi:hypothetical protein
MLRWLQYGRRNRKPRRLRMLLIGLFPEKGTAQMRRPFSFFHQNHDFFLKNQFFSFSRTQFVIQ